MECIENDCVRILKSQKQPSCHSYSELSKTQFFPVSIVKFQECFKKMYLCSAAFIRNAKKSQSCKKHLVNSRTNRSNHRHVL